MQQNKPSTAEPKPSWRVTYLGADEQGAGRNVSWGAILAGTVTFLALLVTFSLIGAAIGLGAPDLESNQAFDGVGTGLLVWAVISLLLALAGAGFVTGVFSVRAGFLHGAVTWAAGVLALLVVLAMAGSAALGAVGSVVGSTLGAAGQGAGAIASAAGDAASTATDSITESIGEVDTAQLEGDVQQVLRDTQIPELQPDYLQGQLDGAGDDVAEAAKTLATDPQNYEQVLEDLTASLQDRADTIGAAADRDAIANALQSNAELTPEEADAAADNIVTGLEQASAEAQTQLDNAQTAIDDARENIATAIDDARETAEQAANAAATAAGWAFIGLIIGLAVTAFAALTGSRLVAGRREDGELRASARD